MAYPPRKLAFILASTDHGTLIVNRFDYKMIEPDRGYGVGYTLLTNGAYDAGEVATALTLLHLRRRYHGDGVIALDCGANIGVFSIEWAKAMTGWGSVLAVEAQERIFYALAGNAAINNCFNLRAVHAAVTASPGVMHIPMPDYQRPGTFGSLELRPSDAVEPIGQPIDYAADKLVQVRAVSVDSLKLPRLDLLKIDVERMEMEVLAGSAETITRCRPVIMVERLKTPESELNAALGQHGYRSFQDGLNVIAVHSQDPVLNHVSQATPPADLDQVHAR